MKKVSIIIVTYNSEHDIYDCVNSIRRYADIPLSEIELVIVDNGSHGVDSMFECLRSLWGEDLVLLKNTHNGGYGQGNNVGIRNSTAPLILIMNPDVRLASHFFAKPLKAFESDAGLCMYGVKQMLTETMESHYSFMCTYMMNGYLRTLIQALCNRLEWYMPRWQYFSGSCFFVRRSMFEEVGLFDESVFMYGEEDDIHWRLMHRWGPHFRYDKSMRYVHLTSERQPDADYEIKFLHVAMKQNEKKGYSRDKTVRQFLRIYRVLYWVESVKVLAGHADDRKVMLKEMLNRIKHIKRKEMGL